MGIADREHGVSGSMDDEKFIFQEASLRSLRSCMLPGSADGGKSMLAAKVILSCYTDDNTKGFGDESKN